jgi:hypothetical protein
VIRRFLSSLESLRGAVQFPSELRRLALRKKNIEHELGQLIPQVGEPIAVKPWG